MDSRIKYVSPVEELKLSFFALGNFFVYVFAHTFDSGVSLHSWMLWPTVRRATR